MSVFPSPWSALFAVVDAVADGLTLAAKTLCPMDHTGVERARAAADALADNQGHCPFHGEWCAGAASWCNRRCSKCDQAVYWHSDAEAWFHEYGLADRPPCPYGDGPVVEHASAASSAAADPSPDVPTRFAAGSGGEGPGPDSVIPQTVGPGQPRLADFVSDDDIRNSIQELRSGWRAGMDVLGLEADEAHGERLIAEFFRKIAEHLDPAEVSAPSVGDEQATSDLLTAAAHQLDVWRVFGAKDTGREGYLSELIPELRARAELFKRIEE